MQFSSTKEKEVNEAMNSGKYRVASLQMFDNIKNIDISDKLYGHLEYTQALVNDYFNDILSLSNKTPGLKEYLTTLKASDILDNQKLEKENSFLLSLYLHTQNETAIDKFIEHIKSNKKIDTQILIDIHKTLLLGTSSQNQNLIRTTNERFVGRFSNGERIIDYFPIDCKDVNVATQKIVELYNDLMSKTSEYDMFLQPFIIHGLVASLQLFEDANTRMARLMQHILMWQLINKKASFNFEQPPIYVTRAYYPFRSEYRQKISKLVTNGDSQAWNDWFDFNLKRLEDQIYMCNENIKILQRKM